MEKKHVKFPVILLLIRITHIIILYIIFFIYFLIIIVIIIRKTNKNDRNLMELENTCENYAEYVRISSAPVNSQSDSSILARVKRKPGDISEKEERVGW